MINDEIKVQVICVTYNQKDYIKEALNSFLMQKTNFNFEVLVGDDCSTDGTSEIVAEYERKYPKIIKHIKRKTNIGCLENFMDLTESASAKYIAFCDGDDYWTDENKLQKQFDFMEKNSDVNVSSHKTKILANEDWALYNYYSKRKEPFIFPELKPLKKLTVLQVVDNIPHTSSLFIRNRITKIPEMLKTGGYIGDISILLLALGSGYFYLFDDVMSVYRRSNCGVIYNDKEIDNFFLQTRVDYFRIFTGVIDYFKKNYNSFGISKLEGRLWKEIINHVNAIVKNDRWDLLIELKEQYPDVYEKAKNLLSEYNLRLTFINTLGVKRANLLREKKVQRKIKLFLSLLLYTRRITKNFDKIFSDLLKCLFYWLFALVPKKKKLWVFSGFKKRAYMDNTKYFYEYLVKNHPEIEAIWLTRDKSVRKQLKKAKMPVHRMNSPIGIWTMIRANIAFCDHFKMSDYTPKYGYNAKTKFVNLWHGVGIKKMIPINDVVQNTNLPGVRLSSDIIINKEDGIFIRIKKRIKYIFKAPFRELFEEYHGILAPGQIFIDTFADPLKIKKESQILCGYPRNADIYTHISYKSEIFSILYAPTYRWKTDDEQKMIDDFIYHLPQINNFLEKYNAAFVLRPHPHTWRNYKNRILEGINEYPRISLSEEKDIYNDIYKYSLLITDYSSIATDFMITKKPIIYLTCDVNSFINHDCEFCIPFKESCAGDIVSNWNEALCSIEKSYKNTEYKKELRDKISEMFYPSEYNDANNSERLVNALKKVSNMEKETNE